LITGNVGPGKSAPLKRHLPSRRDHQLPASWPCPFARLSDLQKSGIAGNGLSRFDRQVQGEDGFLSRVRHRGK
jgi:hypothetical protein